MEFFDHMEPMLRMFWFIALPASLVFVIQSIMTFVGMDGHDGTDADFDGDLSDGGAPFQIFSLRNLVNFLLGFSWAGISFYYSIDNKIALMAAAIVVGLSFVAVFFLMLRQLQKLAEDNSFKVEQTLNKTASVYLSIPANKSGKGKIQISINGSFHELEAITESEERIETGATVIILSVAGNNTLIVKKV